MIKNAIGLLDEANSQLASGQSRYESIIAAGVTRPRPVLLAAATTVLGVIPLYPDVFWNAMAIMIMAGLSFGTILTMFVVPVLYCIFYRVKSPRKA
jgi:multidrug efflux pump subunit AcrB